MLLNNASQKISQYNQFCLHYNFVANAVYHELRQTGAPLSPAFEPFLVAALISFDMGRKMGQGLKKKYDVAEGGFAARLHTKLTEVRSILAPIIHIGLLECNTDALSSAIAGAYPVLAAGGQGGLDEQGDMFHVGTTKLLHFLNPEMFAIVDGNTAQAIREAFGIPYRNTTQPGYSSERYIQALISVKRRIVEYGEEQFRSLEPGTPIMRVFDKIAFAHVAFGA